MMQDHCGRVRTASVYGEHIREEGVPVADLARALNGLDSPTCQDPKDPDATMIRGVNASHSGHGNPSSLQDLHRIWATAYFLIDLTN
jgi:hypothetical protein